MSSIYGSASGANVIYGENNTGVAFGGAAPDPCTYRSGATFTDWTLSGAYAITSGALVADMPVGTANNGDHGYYDIGAANISETAWILRWKWNITGATHTSGANAVVQVGLFSGSESAGTASSIDGSYSSTQEVASCFVSLTGSTEYFQTSTGSASNNAYSGVTRSDMSGDFVIPDSYYFQIKRHDVVGTDTLTYTFTDNPDFTTDVTTVDVTDATYMPANLRYLKVESLQPFTPADNAVTTTIESFTFNNDSSEACT